MLLRVTLVRELNLLPFLSGNGFTQQWNEALRLDDFDTRKLMSDFGSLHIIIDTLPRTSVTSDLDHQTQNQELGPGRDALLA